MGDTSDDNASISSDDSPSSAKNSLSSYLPTSTLKSGTDKLGSEARRIKRDVKSTKDTLEDIDTMLGEYNSLARTQGRAISKLKDNLTSPRARRSSVSSLRSSDLDSDNRRSRGRSTSRRQYRATSPLEDYDVSSLRRSRPRSAVRFREPDDVMVDREHLHSIHRSLRDLSADHERLEDEIDREKVARYRLDREYQQGMSELNTSLHSSRPPIQPNIDTIERRLERKLESIATKIEKQQKKESEQHVTSLSKSLTEALKQPAVPPAVAPQSTSHEFVLQQRISELESDKRKLQTEVDNSKQRSEQGEGARRNLIRQIEELRNQLREVDDERHRAVRIAEDFKDSEKKARKKQRDIARSAEDENQGLQMEIQELRVQLNHSISREDGEMLRRELQKTDKQRVSLTEHIENLTKDVRNRDQQMNNLLSEVTELTTVKNKLENELSTTSKDLIGAQSALSEVKVQLQRSERDVTSLRDDLTAAERRKEEMKNKATEVVKLWKVKCKSIEEESQKYKLSNSEQMEKLEQLHRDNDSLRNQVVTSTHQMDRFGKDMSDLLTANQNLEDKLRHSDSEITHLRKSKSELEHDLHDRQLQVEKFERDSRKLNDTFINYEAENAQLSDKLEEKRNHITQLEEELRDVKGENAHIHKELSKTSQLISERESNVQDLETRVLTSEASESGLRREVEELSARERHLTENIEKMNEDFSRKLDQTRRTNAELKNQESMRSEEYRRRVKQIQAESEAEIQAMRIDLESAESSISTIKRQAKSQNDEFIRLEQKYRSLEEDAAQYKSQCRRLREQHSESQANLHEYSQRAKETELELSNVQSKLSQLEQSRNSLINTINTEVRILVESSQPHTEREFSKNYLTGGDESTALLEHIPAVGSWLRQIIRDQSENIKKMRDELKTVVKQEAREKKALISEIKRQQSSMDDLSERHKEILESTVHQQDEMGQLEEKVAELSFHIEEQKAVDDAVERRNILDRYERLQGAVSSLKSELRMSRSRSPPRSRSPSGLANSQSSGRVKGNLRFTPSKDRQVRIADVVSNNDGTESPLRLDDDLLSPDPSPDVAQRAQAFRDALGSTYRETYINYLNEENGANLRPEKLKSDAANRRLKTESLR